MRRDRVPGAALAVADADEMRFLSIGVGHQDHDTPIDARTIFQVGSISKIVTGTAAMRLVELGELDLDRPVRDWIPDLELADPRASECVTPRDLLHHTGGWNGDYAIDTGRGDDALDRVRPTLAQARQFTAVQSTFHYNNLGFVLLGLTIQAATGEPFEQVVERLVFEPLGLARSSYLPESIIFERIAAGHIVTVDGRRISAYGRPRSRAPNGGVLSCVEDLVDFARCHLNDGLAGNGKRVLTSASVEAMQDGVVPVGVDGVYRGLSWVVSRRYGHAVVSHGGATPGFQSGLWLVPARGWVIVALTNANTGGGVVRAIEAALHETLYGGALPVASAAVDRATFEAIRGIYVNGGALVVDGSVERPMVRTFMGGLDDPGSYAVAATSTPGRFEIIDGPSRGSQFDFVNDGAFLRFGGSRLFARLDTNEDGGRLDALVERYPELKECLARLPAGD